MNTSYVSSLIRDGDFHSIKAVMEKSSESGMQTFDQSLHKLYKQGRIDLKTALANADSSSDLEWKINFGGGVDSNENQDKPPTLQFSSEADE